MSFVGRDGWEIEHKHNTFDRLLQTLEAPGYVSVAFWVHDICRRERVQLDTEFTERPNQEVQNQYLHSLITQEIMNNELYFTMLYRPVVANKDFADRPSEVSILEHMQSQTIKKITEFTANVEAVLRDYTSYRLGTYEGKNGVASSETLELYAYLLNRIEEPTPVLDASVYDYLIVNKQTFSPKNGDLVVATPGQENHLGTILDIKEYPDSTWPSVLNGLKYLDFEYVITHSFSSKGRHDVLKTLERTRDMMIFFDDKAVSQILESDRAMDEASSGNFVLGEYHFTVALHAESQEKLYQRIAAARAELSGAGFVSVREDVATMMSFCSQLAGDWEYRARLADVSSPNFSGLFSLHNFPTGKMYNNSWDDAVTILQATDGWPYYFSFHATYPGENSLGEKAVANTMAISESGMGKTALINFSSSRVQKFDPRPTIFFFDKDCGAEIFVRARGGSCMALDNGQPTGSNPFQCKDSKANIQFLARLIELIVDKKGYAASKEEDIMRVMKAVLDISLRLRTMTNFQKSLPNLGDGSIFARTRKWTREGLLDWVFGNPADTIDLTGVSIIGFDYADVIDNDEARTPVINYLIHRLEELIDGRPLIYVMDEFWKILGDEGELRDFARNKQKAIRKQNELGIFATQSPEDILKSDTSTVLVEQTAAMILSPDPNADKKGYIDGLKLTEAEFNVIVNLDKRSRCFLVRQDHSPVVCQLSLRGMGDVLSIISANTDNIEIVHRIIGETAQAKGIKTDSLHPGQWLECFYRECKGSRNSSAAVKPRL